MQHTVTLPWWIFLLLLAFALYSCVYALLIPLIKNTLRRYSRHARRLLDEQLDFGLSSHVLSRRSIWIDRLLNDKLVADAIEQTASEKGMSLDKTFAEAKTYAKEIVPSFSVLLYFRVGYWLARGFFRSLYWIQVGYHGKESYKNINKNACVVLVTNHRSNFDPFLMIYLASKRAAISYSAGEWARGWPFQQLLHAIGFYIIRRDAAENRLYRAVLERYVFYTSSQGIPQGIFLEGGLSRDGRMQPLKFGLLNYILKAYEAGNCEDVVFIPAGLNYDKTPEDKTLVANQSAGFKGKGRFYSLKSFAQFMLLSSSHLFFRRHKPFGYAGVSFGKPVSLKEWQAAQGIVTDEQDQSGRRAMIQQLGNELVATIKELIPILPAYVLAQVFVKNATVPLSEIEVKVQAHQLIQSLREQGVQINLHSNDEDYAISQGLYLLLKRKIIRLTGEGQFLVVPESQELLDYYCQTLIEVTESFPCSINDKK